MSEAEVWAKVETMGHGLLYGIVSECVYLGVPMLLVTVPELRVGPVTYPAWSQRIAPGAIFRLTELAPAIGRAMAENLKALPIERFSAPMPVLSLLTRSADVEEDCVARRAYIEGPPRAEGAIGGNLDGPDGVDSDSAPRATRIGCSVHQGGADVYELSAALALGDLDLDNPDVVEELVSVLESESFGTLIRARVRQRLAYTVVHDAAHVEAHDLERAAFYIAYPSETTRFIFTTGTPDWAQEYAAAHPDDIERKVNAAALLLAHADAVAWQRKRRVTDHPWLAAPDIWATLATEGGLDWARTMSLPDAARLIRARDSSSEHAIDLHPVVVVELRRRLKEYEDAPF